MIKMKGIISRWKLWDVCDEYVGETYSFVPESTYNVVLVDWEKYREQQAGLKIGPSGVFDNWSNQDVATASDRNEPII